MAKARWIARASVELKTKILNKYANDFICDGFEFDVELLWRSSTSNIRINEVFLPIKSNDNSSVYVKDYFTMLFNILKLRFYNLNAK